MSANIRKNRKEIKIIKLIVFTYFILPKCVKIVYFSKFMIGFSPKELL